MTDFKDRERAEETKFAFDEENAFKIAARRNRLLGEWAATLMGLTSEESDAYRKAVVQADFEEAGDEDVIRKLLGDLTAAECDVSEADIRAKLEEKSIEAKRQLMGES
ncbi:MAG: aldolase [Erythrobacter sp. RIFCSPHIGHO2_12_FULL_63_10]|nr:MAG: aldolase [Erythrobacter sp. RIFCSPHIGHO2_12_FULL_63_10]